MSWRRRTVCWSRFWGGSPQAPAEPVAPLTEAEFRWRMNEDAMATDKLAEGIRGFEADQRRLEQLLRERLTGRR